MYTQTHIADAYTLSTEEKQGPFVCSEESEAEKMKNEKKEGENKH